MCVVCEQDREHCEQDTGCDFGGGSSDYATRQVHIRPRADGAQGHLRGDPTHRLHSRRTHTPGQGGQRLLGL